MDCPIHTEGRLREWRIFTRRQNDSPNAENGAVCRDITCYGRAVVIPGVTTEPAVYADQVVGMCVASGEGQLRLKGDKHALQPGSSFLIPPGQEYRFKNTGDVELEFIFARRPPSSTDGDFALHHWTEDRPRQEWGTAFQGHWNHTYRGPACEVHIADLPPHKFSHPHSHSADLDEIWYVHRGPGWHWMGQEYRLHYPGWALWLDPSELHALMNPSETTVEYIYATSAALVRDRQLAQQKEEKLPTGQVRIAAALEQQFAELIAAYQKTGLSIHDVDRNIAPVQRLIRALKK
jgi:mannose-6-phosphate isomerase-like protein (cupin superfamily)